MWAHDEYNWRFSARKRLITSAHLGRNIQYIIAGYIVVIFYPSSSTAKCSLTGLSLSIPKRSRTFAVNFDWTIAVGVDSHGMTFITLFLSAHLVHVKYYKIRHLRNFEHCEADRWPNSSDNLQFNDKVAPNTFIPLRRDDIMDEIRANFAELWKWLAIR